MTSKREAENSPKNDDSDDDCIGPSLSEAAPPKKRKTLEYEHIYLSNLPSSESYEKSYMHRDVVSHVAGKYLLSLIQSGVICLYINVC